MIRSTDTLPNASDPTTWVPTLLGQILEVTFDANGHLDDFVYRSNPDTNSDDPAGSANLMLDSFQFVVEDNGVSVGSGQAADPKESDEPGTATIRVLPINSEPVLVDDQLVGTEGTNLAITVAQLLGNDDVSASGAADETRAGAGVNDPGNLSIDLTVNTSAGVTNQYVTDKGGAIIVSGTDITYTPPADFYGVDTFTYNATDAGLSQRLVNGLVGPKVPDPKVADPDLTDAVDLLGTVSITVMPVNDIPLAETKTYGDVESIDEDARVTIAFTKQELLANSRASESADPLTPNEPFDEESTQSLRVVRFETATEVVDVRQPQDYPGLDDVTGDGTVTINSGTLGGTFSFTFSGGEFTSGVYTPALHFNRDTTGFPESFNYIIADDDGAGTPVPDSNPPLVVDLPSADSDPKRVVFDLSPINTAPTFARIDGSNTFNVLETDDGSSTSFQVFNNVYPGNPPLAGGPGMPDSVGSLDETQNQQVEFTINEAQSTYVGLLTDVPDIDFDPLTRTVTLTVEPALDQVGEAIFVIDYKDVNPQDAGFVSIEGSETVTVFVRPVNDAPSLVDFNTATFDLSASDPSAPSDFAYAVDTGDGSIAYTIKEDPNDYAGGGYLIPLQQSSGAAYNPIGLLDVFSVGAANESQAVDGGYQELVLQSFNLPSTEDGTLELITDNGEQFLLYRPSENYNSDFFGGEITFTYTVADSYTGPATSGLDYNPDGTYDNSPLTINNTVRVNVVPVNDEPSFELRIDSHDTTEKDGTELPVSVGLVARNIMSGPATAQDETTTLQPRAFVLTPSNFDASELTTLFTIAPSIDPINGTLTYQPAPDVFASLVFDVTLDDEGPETSARGDDDVSDAQQFTINITPVNDPPQINLSEYRDLVGDPTAQFDGTLTFDADEQLPPDPNVPYQPVTFRVSGPAQPGEIDLVSLFDPGPANEQEDVAGGNQLIGEIVFPGTSVNGILRPDDPNNPTTYEYIPTVGFVGEQDLADSFEISVFDNGEVVNGQLVSPPQQITVTVNVNVQGINNPPVFTPGANDTLTVNVDEFAIADGTLTIANWATSVLPGPVGSPDELAGQQIIGADLTITQDTNGLFAANAGVVQPTATLNGDSLTLSFRPNSNLSGEVDLTLRITDSGANDSTNGDVNFIEQDFKILVNVVNDAPSFDAQSSVSIAEPPADGSTGVTSYTIDGWASNISPGAGEETDQSVDAFRFDPASPAGLLLSVDPSTGDLTIGIPEEQRDFNGQVVTSVTAVDSLDLTSDPFALTITVTPVNDHPVAVTDMLTGDEDLILSIDPADLVNNDEDADIPFDPNETLTAVLSDTTITSVQGATVRVVNVGGEVRFEYDPTKANALQSLGHGEVANDTFTVPAIRCR